mmetsp:Transcript_33493/g.72471  ORF Transcript_33493/g.72471 Transcript_33493/m.72471 type:complete len:137 (-) Transcript_33493:808-1218(-)
MATSFKSIQDRGSPTPLQHQAAEFRSPSYIQQIRRPTATCFLPSSCSSASPVPQFEDGSSRAPQVANTGSMAASASASAAAAAAAASVAAAGAAGMAPAFWQPTHSVKYGSLGLPVNGQGTGTGTGTGSGSDSGSG